MTQLLLLFISSLSLLAVTHDIDSSCNGISVTLDQFKWENRVLLIFAEDSDSDMYQAQIKSLHSHQEGLTERDLIIFSVFDQECSNLDGNEIDDISAERIRNDFSDQKEAYSIFLIGKDGGVKLHKNQLLDIDELFNAIDRMPMRKREMRDGS